MEEIILTEAALSGIQGAVKKKPEMSKEYQELVQEADKKIEKNRFGYAHAYKTAATHLAR